MKFEFLGKEYDLEEIVGSDNLYPLDRDGDPNAERQAFGIYKAGCQKLEKHFPMIKIMYGPVEFNRLGTMEMLYMEGIASVTLDDGTRLEARDFGEVSPESLSGLGSTFPIATLIARTTSRVLMKIIGIPDVYGEEELAVPEKKITESKPAKTAEPANAANITEKVNKIKSICSQRNLSDEDRYGLWRKAIGNDSLTPAQIVPHMTVENADKVLEILENNKVF